MTLSLTIFLYKRNYHCDLILANYEGIRQYSGIKVTAKLKSITKNEIYHTTSVVQIAWISLRSRFSPCILICVPPICLTKWDRGMIPSRLHTFLYIHLRFWTMADFAPRVFRRRFGMPDMVSSAREWYHGVSSAYLCMVYTVQACKCTMQGIQ